MARSNTPSENAGRRFQSWARPRGRITIAVAGIAAVVTILATTTVIEHAQADWAYQSARVHALTQYRSDLAAQKHFATALSHIAALRTQMVEIHDQAAAGHFLPSPQINAISAEISRLNMYAGFKPGTPVVDPDPQGKPTSTTQQLVQETARLRNLMNEQANAAATTSKGCPGIVQEAAAANKVLDRVIVGSATAQTTTEPALSSDAAVVVLALNKAGQGEKDALTAAASAAQEGVKGGKDPAPLLLAYLAKATEVNASHKAAVAAEAVAAAAAAAQAAAANAAQNSYADPTTGDTGSAPRRSSGGSSSGGSSSTGETSSPAGGGGGTSSVSGGSGGGTYTPPPVDHTPHVIANGAYTPGCVGVEAYSQSTSSGGTIIINVSYPYKYSTFSTTDGWGLTVYGCA